MLRDLEALQHLSIALANISWVSKEKLMKYISNKCTFRSYQINTKNQEQCWTSIQNIDKNC